MELFGVYHGASFDVGPLTLERVKNLHPAEEILNSIEQLPTGSRVGIESANEFHSIISEYLLRHDYAEERYWREIIDASQDTGHGVVYLDSYDLHLESAQKRHEVDQIENILSGDEFDVVEGKERELEEMRFALRAVASHIFFVQREDAIFKSMADNRPDIAVIGLGHADTLMLSPNLPSEMGISKYTRVVNDDGEYSFHLAVASEGNWPMHQKVDPSPPDLENVKFREGIVRNYRAAILGRVMDSGEPAWVGSWRPSCRPEGLFELYPNSNEGGVSTGVIEDSLGTASYNGEFGDKKIEFEKVYDTATTLGTAVVQGVITYEALKSSAGEYEGVWFSEDGLLSGEFVMREGSQLYVPPDLTFGRPTLF